MAFVLVDEYSLLASVAKTPPATRETLRVERGVGTLDEPDYPLCQEALLPSRHQLLVWYD